MAILQHIRDRADELADSEAKVARAILADPGLLEHYTITSLAQHAGTSTSAVLRFCHSLGYAGFKDFRYELNAEVQRGEGRGSADQDPLAAAAEGMGRAVARLAELDRTTIDELVRQIASSTCVFCIGIHRSSLPAAKLRMDLEDLGIMAVSLADTVSATHAANLVDDQSCTIIFSASGSQTSYRAALDAGLVAQGSSWVISPSAHPQLAAYVGHVIVLPSARHAGAATVDEHPVAMAFVELLTLELKAFLREEKRR